MRIDKNWEITHQIGIKKTSVFYELGYILKEKFWLVCLFGIFIPSVRFVAFELLFFQK